MAQNIYDNSDFFAGYSQLPGRCMGWAARPNGRLSGPCCRR